MIKGLILSGGAGSGLLPLTIHTPKPLLPVANFPLLLFQIQQLKKAGITEIILSISYQPRKLKDTFGDGSNFGVMLRYAVESPPAGTAGAFKRIENLVDDTTVVMNGDILSQAPLDELVQFHRSRGAVATIGTQKVPNPRGYGVVETGAQGRVLRFLERPRKGESAANTINAGLYILEPEILQWIPPDQVCHFEKQVFAEILKKKAPFFASPVRGYWTEITRPDNYLRSNMDFLSRKISLPEFAALRNRKTSRQSQRTYPDSLIDEPCIIKSGARIEKSVIGKNCRIDQGAVIRSSVIWPGCRIQRNALLSGSILGRSCLIGEGARIRKGNILGDKSNLTSHSST